MARQQQTAFETATSRLNKKFEQATQNFIRDAWQLRTYILTGLGQPPEDEATAKTAQTPIIDALNLWYSPEFQRSLEQSQPMMLLMDEEGRSAAHLAAMHGYTDVLKAINAVYPQLLRERSANGQILPLVYAETAGHKETAAYLREVAFGADVMHGELADRMMHVQGVAESHESNSRAIARILGV